MPKTVPAGLATHLAGELLTIANLFQLTRTDTVVKRFTDHNKDVPFGGNTYEAESGLLRSGLAGKSDFSVTNAEMEGILDSEQIDEADLRAGLYDFADIRISIVNYEDPDGDGALVLFRGILGEIRMNKKAGRYEAEMRGITQILGRRIGRVYTLTCPVDLFSAECGLDADGIDSVTGNPFREFTEVDTVSDKRTFTVPLKATLRDNDPDPDTAGATEIAVSAADLVTMQRDLEDGTEQRPFLIGTPVGLDQMRDDPYSCYALTADLDFNAEPDWTMIEAFYGKLDGRGFEIQNITYISGSANKGFIRRIRPGGKVTRLGIVNPTWASTSAGQGGALMSGGGLQAAGREPPVIEDCYAYGGSATTGNNNEGGLVGAMHGDMEIRRCIAAVPLDDDSGVDIGGIIGDADGASNVTVEDCYFDGDAAGTVKLGNGLTTAEVTALTRATAHLQASYPGLDFVNTWKIERLATMAGDPGLTWDSAGKTLTRAAGSWDTDGFAVGQRVQVTGSTDNDTTGQEISTITTVVNPDDTITFIAAETLVDEGPVTGITVIADDYPRLLDPGRYA